MKVTSMLVGLSLFGMSMSFAQTVEQGLKHKELEQYESSKKVFNGLIKKDPANPEYYYQMGEVYINLDKQDSASYFFKESIKKKDDFALAYVGLGKVLAASNPGEGKKSFDKALELSKSKDEKVLAAIAEYYINAPTIDYAQAISLLEKAIKADAKNPNHYLLMGDAYLGKGDGTKAMSYYNQGLALNKTWPYPYLKIGKLYTNARNYDLAVQNYNKGLEIDANYGPLHREIGEVYYKAKKYNKAIASYKKYVELSDKNFDTDLRYASFLYFNKDYANAITLLNELAKKDPKHYVVNRLLSYSLYETGDYKNGMTQMENFWKNTDSKKYLASDYEYYGKLYSKSGNDSLAIVNMRKAIEMDTSKSDLYSEIGNIYFLAKRYPEAAREYTLKVTKGTPTAQDYLVLGRSYYNDKKYAQADSAFTKLVESVPTSPTGYLWRARANAYQDENLSKGLAKPFYEKYISLTTDVEKFKKELVEAYSSIGAYHMKRNDKANADIAWKKVKELDPANKEVDKYLKAAY